MKKNARAIVVPLMCMILSGCLFDPTNVQYSPTEIHSEPSANDGFTLTTKVELDDLPCGYSRTLRSGVVWVPVGEVPKGTVYRSPEQPLTLECSNVSQAYLVIKEKTLVGFYLPVEKGFVALGKPVLLPIKL